MDPNDITARKGKNKMHDVFVSFSFKNMEVAHQIVNGLQTRYGIRCWICTQEVYGGNYYKQKITRAIDEARVVVLVQTIDAIQSREVPKEIAIAFEGNKVIIPFKLDDAKAKDDLRYDLAGIDFIDGRKPTFDERIDELAEAILRNLETKKEQTESMGNVLASQRLFYNEIFVGRDAVISQLEEAFRERTVVFLHGMGGIGKSEIAKQYAKRNATKYDTVVFARYQDSLAALLADDRVFSISGMNRKTKADNTLQDDEEYARDKLNVLRDITDQSTLIIIDNFDVTADPLLESVTNELPCHVLFTTRCKPETGRYFTLTVPEMDDAALREMMICYADPEEIFIDPADPDFPELFDLVGRHTLTLELIAKRMAEDGIDEVGEIVRLLRKGKLSSLTGGDGIDAYGRIRELFRLSQLTEQECSFLRCLAMMPADGVLQKMFRQWSGDDFSARAHLMKLSLIRLDTQTKKLFLHPVLREVIINELQPCFDNCRGFVEQCTMVGVENASGLMWCFDYATKKNYMDAYMSILPFFEEITIHTYPAVKNMLYLFNYVGPVEETIALHKRLLTFTKAYFGEESAEVTHVYNNIGWKYSNAQMFEKAVEYLQIAADRTLATGGPYTRTDFGCLNTCSHAFAYLYQKTGEAQYFEKALEYLQKNVAIADEQYLEYTLQHTYFKYCCMQGDYAQAKVHADAFRAAREKYAKGGAGYDVDHAYVVYHRGIILANTGKEEEAILVLMQSIEEYMKYFSTKNARIVDMYELLLKCHIAVGDKPKALACADRAIEIARILYTEDHPQLQRLKKMRKECQ